MNKKSLSESDICDRYISPALTSSGWENHQWRREYAFTDGRIIVRGRKVARGKQKRADYLLFYKPNLPIAVDALLKGVAAASHGRFEPA